MSQSDAPHTGAAPSHDPAALSGAHRRTLERLFGHPLAHNLDWNDVAALFRDIGEVEERPNHELVFHVDGERVAIRKPHGKDATGDDVRELRRLLAKTGWSPHPAAAATDDAGPPASDEPAAPDLLVVIDHHEARIFEMDVGSDDASEHVVRPYDPHHFLHHLTHKDQSRERGQRTPEESAYYEAIAKALAAGGRIVLVGRGTGKSNAAHHLAGVLAAHHPETFQRVVSQIEADLSAATQPQLLRMAREALR